MESRENNVGDLDSAVRWAAGITLIALGLSKWRWWGVLGILPLYSAATRYCPINKALGIDTSESGQEPAAEESSHCTGPVPANAESSRRNGLEPAVCKHVCILRLNGLKMSGSRFGCCHVPYLCNGSPACVAKPKRHSHLKPIWTTRQASNWKFFATGGSPIARSE